MVENAQELTHLMSEINPENQLKIERLVLNYHKSLDKIETNLKKEINQCPEPLLLPLQAFASNNQYISTNSHKSHLQIIDKLQNGKLNNTTNSNEKSKPNQNQRSRVKVNSTNNVSKQKVKIESPNKR